MFEKLDKFRCVRILSVRSRNTECKFDQGREFEEGQARGDFVKSRYCYVRGESRDQFHRDRRYAELMVNRPHVEGPERFSRLRKTFCDLVVGCVTQGDRKGSKSMAFQDDILLLENGGSCHPSVVDV